MKAIPIHEVKTNLSKYVKQAKAGKPVYFGSFGRNEVVLMATPNQAGNKKRNFSLAKGKITDKAGAFTTSTDEEISNLMYGS